METILEFLFLLVTSIFAWYSTWKSTQEPMENTPEPVVPPVTPEIPSEEPQVPEVPQYSWTDQKGAYKLTRIIADDLGLTVKQKNILCACIYQESRFRNRLSDGSPTKNENRDETGKVWSTDYGIVQVNDYWHIGKGKTFPSLEYVMDNPDLMVKWMAKTLKTTGHLQPWSSYTSGIYTVWLSPDSPMWLLKP